MSHKLFRLTFAAVLLTVTSVLAACSSSKAPDAPLSSAGGSTAASHPEWSQYTFTIGDNGGDGSEELSKVTGAFDGAPYKVKFARFDYGPPLVQAAVSAIKQCAPYTMLPAAKYKEWRVLDINFSPDEMARS